MKGLLIYDEEGAQRNEWFINSFLNHAKKYNIDLKLIIFHSLNELILDEHYDFAIVRTINYHLNELLEQQHIRVFNNAKTSRIANNKYLTYKMCCEHNITCMNTFLLKDNYPLLKDLAFPIVIKSLNGHGGNDVFLVQDENEFHDLCPSLIVNNYIIQPLCSKPGVDKRVYVLGNKIIASVLRSSTTDFRSNYSLGGQAFLTEVDNYQKSIIRKIHTLLQNDLIGVDFIYHHGQWILNEIEDVVGTRMLYATSDIDIVDIYIQYIIDKIKNC